MVLISSKKYACETCIKGHRSSSCQHTDRPLYEIKKKGRPVTQCEHCRELRKTKQVHVKCICQKVDGAASATASSSSGKKSVSSFLLYSSFAGVSKMLESAAFPNGLPEALEASVALQLLSEGTSSDSDHGKGCSCKSGGECNCCTPRKSAPRTRKKEIPSQSRPPAVSVDATSGSELPAPDHKQALSHVLGRIAELRPVLPKPARRGGDIFTDGPVHDPSVTGIGPNRHHAHEFYSPYGRAYDNTHPKGHSHAYQQSNPQLQLDIPNYTTTSNIPHDIRDPEYLPTQNNFPFVSPIEPTRSPDPGSSAAENDVWNVFQQYGVLCGCGDACACPNCLTHRGASNPVTTPNNTPTNSPSHTSRSCVNPDACGACIECLMFPPSFSLSTTISSPDADSMNVINDGGNDNSNAPDINQWLASLPQSALDSIMSGPIPPFQLTPTLDSDERMEPGRESPSCQCPPSLCDCNNCNGRCQSSSLPGQGYDERRGSPPYTSTLGDDYSSNNPMYTEHAHMGQLRLDLSQPSSVWEAVDLRNDYDFWNPSSQSLDPMMSMRRTRSGSSSSSEASSNLSRFSAEQPPSPVFSDGPASGHSSEESLHGTQGMGFGQGMGLQEFY